WKSRDAAACIALSSLLPESEETHFTQVRTASEFLTAIKARYATPTTVSLGRLFLPFLFPDLASFERTADLITHLRSLDSSYRAACTDAQLALLPPPMAITIYFIVTSLPGRLALVRDALLLKHPSELTMEVLESALKDIESNLRSVASASGAVPPPLFHGCTVPQLPTFTASFTTATTDVTAAAVTNSSRSRGRSGRRGGQGAGGGGGGGVASGGGGSAGAGGAPRAAAGDFPATAGGGDARVRQPPIGLPTAGGGAAAWYLTQRQQQQQQPLSSQQPQQQQPLSLQQPQQQQRQQQVSGQGSGQRQLQRGVIHPPCTYHVLTGARRGQPCGHTHPPGQCFAQLTDTVRLAFGVDGPALDWLPLVQTCGPTLWGMSASQLVDLLGTPHAMYAVADSSASDSVCSSVVSLGASLAEVPVASVGMCIDTSPGAAPKDASLSFTLGSGASHGFLRDRTTLTPLPTPVSVALADPTLGPVTGRYTTTLPLLVSQHVGVWIEPFGKTAVCVDGDMYAHLATFSAEPGSGLYTLHTGPRGQQQQQQRQQLLPPTPVNVPRQVPASHQVAASPQVAVSGQVPVSGLPRVLPSLPPSLAPPCGPCVEGRLHATLYSSSLRLATEPFETLHLDVWGLTSHPGPERESFFLVVVDDYSRYSTMFPQAKKCDVTSMLIRWLLTTADTRGHHVSCLHSDRGGLVMEIARTSMTHACAPYCLWPYATGSRGVASRFRVWGCLALVRDTSADKISPRVVTCVLLGFPEESSDYTFYHPPLHRFFYYRDVRFDESVPYYVRYPCRGLPVPPPPLFLTSAPPPAPPVQPPPPCPAPSGVSHATPPPSVAPQVQPPSLQSSSQPTANPAGAGFRGKDPGGASSQGAGVGVETVPVRGAGVSGVVPGGATTEGAPSAGPREPGTDPVTSGGAGSRGGASGSLESGPGATTAPDTTPPPHPHPTRRQARVRRAREEQLELEREERELERQQLELQRLEEQQQ
ncbi:unnamed protein product, partial [Closterium sp. NIES-54]